MRNVAADHVGKNVFGATRFPKIAWRAYAISGCPTTRIGRWIGRWACAVIWSSLGSIAFGGEETEGGVDVAAPSAPPGISGSRSISLSFTMFMPEASAAMTAATTTAVPHTGFADPAAENVAAEPKERQGKTERFTVTAGGRSKTVAFQEPTPPTLFAAVHPREVDGEKRNVTTLTFQVGQPQGPLADYRVKCWYHILPGCHPEAGGFRIGETYFMGPSVHRFVLTRGDGKSVLSPVEAALVRIGIATPHGDPTIDPRTDGGGANETNELVFSEAETDPTCVVNCAAEATPYAEKLRWKIVDQPGSAPEPTWHWEETDAQGEPATPPPQGAEGRGTTNVRAVYTGLFEKNGMFGKRKVQLTMDIPELQGEKDETDIEVFYLRNESNHSDSVGETASTPTPNWFFYWTQALDYTNCVYNAEIEQYGIAPAMYYWSNPLNHKKTEVWFGPSSCTEDTRRDGSDQRVSGIDFFVNVYLHENKHVEQIKGADQILIDHNLSTGIYASGWSWNKHPNNHFIPAGRWQIRLSAVIGDAPTAWGKSYDLEGEAESAEANNEHAHARKDWGCPGKQHMTNNKYDD